jgi:hypothetical protein
MWRKPRAAGLAILETCAAYHRRGERIVRCRKVGKLRVTGKVKVVRYRKSESCAPAPFPPVTIIAENCKISVLEILSENYQNQKIAIIMDGAGWHKSKDLFYHARRDTDFHAYHGSKVVLKTC